MPPPHLREQSVTHVLGIPCYPCLRKYIKSIASGSHSRGLFCRGISGHVPEGRCERQCVLAQSAMEPDSLGGVIRSEDEHQLWPWRIPHSTFSGSLWLWRP